ncbi:hypothetical protein [Tellurirhabdus bombi]|uniref:hypothetical protein n=1 Tax=Tellurirhabdus bombi TaxID=2907205 RepID=UPI001F38A2E7|nr:hypothetical protein [Tellurirhabdus bombi]
MGFFKNIALAIGLIWALALRVYPAMGQELWPAHSLGCAVVSSEKEKNPSNTDGAAAVASLQTEDEQDSSSTDYLPLFDLPLAMQLASCNVSVLSAGLTTIPVGKRAGPALPYYLLFCSLRIPLQA